MTAKKNVLLIVVDQLRADCLHGALAEHVDLPNLRSLAAESVRFDRHFSVTNPCGPSRASILTGQYAMNHRSVRNGTPLRHDIPTIASEMRRAGYLPMLFGYTDTSNDPRVFCERDPALTSYEFHMSGFQEMVEMRMEESYPWRSYLKGKGYTYDTYEDLFQPVAQNGEEPDITDPAPYAAEDSDTAFLTDRFLELMPAYQERGNGWFSMLTYLRPHPPLVAPAPYNKMYDPARMPDPVRLSSPGQEDAIHPFFAPARANATALDMVSGIATLDESDDVLRKLRAVYFGLATELDHHIGRVIDFLKDSGQYDNTLLIVTADHGEMLGDRHSWGKNTVYDPAYHTPLIIRAPAGQQGLEVDAQTESIDLAPTILEWIGQTVPDSMNGASLLPFLSGHAPQSWRRFSFSELDFANPLSPSRWQKELGTGVDDSCLSILRDDRFTLVEFAADLAPLLFDHQGNGEMENVADQPEYAQTLARLTREMLRHRMRHMDKLLSNWMITKDGPRHP